MGICQMDIGCPWGYFGRWTRGVRRLICEMDTGCPNHYMFHKRSISYDTYICQDPPMTISTKEIWRHRDAELGWHRDKSSVPNHR